MNDDMDQKEHSEEDNDHDIIDEDLHETFTDDELQEMMAEARREYRWKERQRDEEKKKKKSGFTKVTIWIIAFAMVFNIVALLPETFSIPAIQFLKTSASLSTQSDIKEYKKAVVLIETAEGKGTGFAFSDDGKIMTNYHVIEGYEEVTIGFPDDGLFVGSVTETYPDIDLAIVEIDNEEKVPVLDLADNFELNPEEEIYFIGNPLKFTGIANKGEVLDYVEVESKEQPVVMMDAPVYRGNSGSPVINKDGKVIGVVFATLFHDEAGRVGLFVPIDDVYEARQGTS